MRTTVIIPAYRAMATLPSVLDALGPQLGPDREAILVDSSGLELSTDAAERWPWLRIVSLDERTWPGKARNVGAASATGELLAFLDADAVPSPHWIARLEAAVDGDVDAVGGAVVNGTPESRVGTAEYLLEFSEAMPRRGRALRHAPSCNLLVRRESFLALGGFPEQVRAGEDTLLTFPLAERGRLRFAPDATVAHLNRTELHSFLANQRLLGQAFIVVCRSVPFPHRWICRGPALILAAPLRLAALTRRLLDDRSQVRGAVRALPFLMLGVAAWTAGVFAGRRTYGSAVPAAGVPPRDIADGCCM